MHICVVVPVFNGPFLLDRCLDTVVNQIDDDFSVVIADDASDDLEIVQIGQAYASEDHVFYVRNDQNLGATHNLVGVIRDGPVVLEPTDVILIVDGDDRLSHDGVLRRLREVYAGDVEMTYGSYLPDPYVSTCYPAREIPAEILATGSIRAFTEHVGQWFNHPISFRRRAFDSIPLNDFHWAMDEGLPWLRFGYDRTIGLPLLERVGRRAAFVPDFLYVYTSDRAEACWREYPEEISAEATEVHGWGWRHAPYDT